jgi:tetratricopeptide (TPR) repeat protein
MRRLLALLLLIATPALAQTGPGSRASAIDALIGALKAAPDEQVASQIEDRLELLWSQGVAPSALLLVRRSARELSADANQEALDDIEAALVLDPAAPEAYRTRALARYALGDYPGALADLQEALTREPRYFPALESLSRLAEDQGDSKGALEAWKRVLSVSPKTPGSEERLKTLTKKALGEST